MRTKSKVCQSLPLQCFYSSSIHHIQEFCVEAGVGLLISPMANFKAGHNAKSHCSKTSHSPSSLVFWSAVSAPSVMSRGWLYRTTILRYLWVYKHFKTFTRNISFRNSLRWLIFNALDKPSSCNTPSILD